MAVELDRLDIQILNLLQEDAAMPLRRIAGLVHASAATCQRRIAQLRANGALAGDRSHVAVAAPSQQAAQAFFDAAMGSGATALREPGLGRTSTSAISAP
ncbi:Lrp/AsnC family transcriptional regulator [Duganella sp. BJB488]|uniref:Lrp/AsnC family transcriptional regulator n=1 Tax=unclassified Duganella TaxID=2636909 RepID=UPI000E3473DE|nr:Lrp/AsnC family transcriptional regulator [Duganella sp. BJB489]RFP17366.1 Lrp/AsnC family transcriptional regulator [Duganella sp. BJB488]RFP31844.1 Lrp/AsnC family transcriptional regulator [Duganella sp. BJB480]